MSDISATGRDNSRELDALKQEHEKKVSKLRAEQQKAEAELKESGDAAVNHIKKATAERVEHARTRSQEKLQHEDELLRKDYTSLKRRSANQNEALEDQIRGERVRAERTLAEVRERDLAVVERSQEQLKDFLGEQQNVRAKAQKVTQTDVTKAQQHANQELAKTKLKSREDVEHVNSENRQKIESLRSNNRKMLDDTKQQAQMRLDQIRTANESKLEKERQTGSSRYMQMRDRITETAKRQEYEGVKRLQNIREHNEKTLEETSQRGLKSNEKLLATYTSEAQRVQSQGEQEIAETEVKFDGLRKEQKAVHRDELQKLEADQLALEYRSRKEHENRLNTTISKLELELKEQRQDFAERYDKDGQVFKDSLTNQKQKFLQELYKQKSQLDSRSRLETERSKDPFYNLKGFDASLEESSNAYRLEAKVAPHEIESVDVKVKGDKITLSSRRAHEDKAQDNGVKLSTNTYQTYRQEFQLGAPADPKKVVKKIGEDGTISVLIPKMNFTSKA